MMDFALLFGLTIWGMFIFFRRSAGTDWRRNIGGVPERLKGTGCKPVGYAYVGSNPTSSTTSGAEKV